MNMATVLWFVFELEKSSCTEFSDAQEMETATLQSKYEGIFFSHFAWVQLPVHLNSGCQQEICLDFVKLCGATDINCIHAFKSVR